MIDIEQIYRIGYTTREKEKDYDPLGNEAVCAAIEDIRQLQAEVERLKGMEPLLKMFLKDGYDSPTGRISKKTGLAMVRYVAANGINSFDL